MRNFKQKKWFFSLPFSRSPSYSPTQSSHVNEWMNNSFIGMTFLQNIAKAL